MDISGPSLPHPTDRLNLGTSGLRVSPFCLGRTASPETVLAAWDAGVNFFFLTADLHWPLYDGLRKGLAALLARHDVRRDDIVVGVVSYLDEPLFSSLQLQEVLVEVPKLERVDLIIAGAVSTKQSLQARSRTLAAALKKHRHGARAAGATFHQRLLALPEEDDERLDISFIRFNSAHPGARQDVFPRVGGARHSLLFSFNCAASAAGKEMFDAQSLPVNSWFPDACDHYRFALSHPQIAGVLFSPASAGEMRAMARVPEKGPLSQNQLDYMIWLAARLRSGAPTAKRQAVSVHEGATGR